jgi:alcohol dehydrogenase, propanol-preferring
MNAVRYLGSGTLRHQEIAEPVLAPGEVRLRVTAAGICHSDVRLIDGTSIARLDDHAPFTIGHEVAGVGLGLDGGLAEFVTVDARRLVDAHGLDPAVGAVLTDAALTSFHAVAHISWRATSPHLGVVIGVGGLGHLAVQLLEHMDDRPRILAVDVRRETEELALMSGADVFCTPEHLAETVRQESTGHGATAVLDFVGSHETLAAGEAVLAARGDLVLVGSSGGALTLSKTRLGPRRGLSYHVPTWGTLPELRNVIDLGRRGVLRPRLSRIPLSRATEGIDDLSNGRINGRLVATEF